MGAVQINKRSESQPSRIINGPDISQCVFFFIVGRNLGQAILLVMSPEIGLWMGAMWVKHVDVARVVSECTAATQPLVNRIPTEPWHWLKAADSAVVPSCTICPFPSWGPCRFWGTLIYGLSLHLVCSHWWACGDLTLNLTAFTYLSVCNVISLQHCIQAAQKWQG